MSIRRSTAIAAIACTVSIAPACKRSTPPDAPVAIPTENMVVVSADPGPGLRKPGPHQHSDATTHKGDVLSFVSPSKTVEWADRVEDERLTRSGPMLEVKRLPSEPSFFMWASDLRREVPVATASYLCSKIPGAGRPGLPCEQVILRRLVSDGTTVGFVSCTEGACPIVIAGVAGTGVTQLEGVDDLRAARLGSRDVLIASTHSSGNGKTGQELVVLAAEPQLRRIGMIPYVEADPSRPDILIWQIGSWKVLPEGIRVQGERAVVERATNKRLETRTIDDIWVLTAEGTLQRRAAAPVPSP